MKPSTRDVTPVSYSLGDAIDWKHEAIVINCYQLGLISYSLGDAIDWKLYSGKTKEGKL